MIKPGNIVVTDDDYIGIVSAKSTSELVLVNIGSGLIKRNKNYLAKKETQIKGVYCFRHHQATNPDNPCCALRRDDNGGGKLF